MKTSALLITFSIVIIFTFFSCQQKPDKRVKTIGVYNEGDCRLAKISYDYPDMNIELEFTYSEKNIVSKIKRTVNGYEGRKPELSYNSNNQLEKFEIFHEDTLTNYESYSWEKDRVLMSLYGYEEGEWVTHNKVMAHFNEFGEMISLDDFYVDSLGVWSRKGTLYDFVWENGNVVNIKNFIVKDSKERKIDISVKNKYLMVTVNDEEYIVDNYSELEEYYTSTFEYSEDINPVNHGSIANLIAPNYFNCSRCLPTKKIQRYTNGDIITESFSWNVNDKGYITNGVVKANIRSEEQFAETEYKVKFEYTNCK